MAYIPNVVFQPYIAPQPEQPVAEFDNLGKVLNERYDKNIAQWDELDAYMNQVQLSEADEGIRKSAISDTRNILKEIREKGNWETSRMQVREVAKRLANDPAITLATQNFKRAQEQRDLEGKMRMQGINLVDFNTSRFNQSTIDPATGRARTLNYDSTEKLLDFDSRRKSLYEGLTPDGYDNDSSSLTAPDPRTGAIYQVGSGSSARYVSANKVKAIAQRNLDNYLSSTEGQQEMKVLTTSNSMNGKPLTEKEARQEILKNITNTGLTRVFNQTGSKSSMGLAYAGSMGSGPAPELESDREIALPITQSESNSTISSLVSKLDTKQPKTDVIVGSGVVFGPGGVGATSARMKGEKEVKATLTPQEEKTMKDMAVMLGIKGTNGKFSDADKKKIFDFAKERQETGFAPKVRVFTKEEIAQGNNYIDNNVLKSAGFWDLEENKFVEYKQLPSAQRAELEKKDGNVKFTGVISADNQFYDLAKKNKREKNSDGWLRPRYISIGGKDYAVTSDISESNKADIEFTRAINQLTSANRYGKPARLKGPDGVEIITYPTNQRGRDGQPLYEVKDLDGNVIATLPLNDLAGKVRQGLKIQE